MSAGGAWAVERTEGPAAELHGRSLPEPLARTVWIHHVADPALVLGSSQHEGLVDVLATHEQGVEVVRRRSGGGAVLLVPGRCLWVDIIVPAGDPLWDDDVVRAADWVGGAWVAALDRQGVRGRAHHGRLDEGRWGSSVCFAGVGPGEVLVEGRKVVGLSQRRTRGAARFQCVVDPDWQATALLSLLALAPGSRARAARDLAPPRGWRPSAIDLDRLEQDLVDLLPG